MTDDYCADYSWCEPLNLVKKKPSKPVAVVAPSSVIDNSSSSDKLKNEHGISESGNRTSDNGGNKSNNARNNRKINNFHQRSDVMKHYADFMCEKDFSFNKNNSVEEKSNDVLNLTAPLPTPTPERVNNGFYSVFNNLANCEQNFLTALYMRNLMHMSLMAPPPNGGMMSPPGLGLNNGGTNQFVNGSYPSSYFGNHYHPFVPSSLNEEVSLSPLIAQQRFWQMVSLASADKNILELQEDAREYQMRSSLLTESLSINVPSVDSTPTRQQGFTILKIPNSKDDFSSSTYDVSKSVSCSDKKVKNR